MDFHRRGTIIVKHEHDELDRYLGAERDNLCATTFCTNKSEFTYKGEEFCEDCYNWIKSKE